MNQERTGEVEESGEADTAIEQDFAGMADQARDTIEQFVHQRPHAALGLAAAVGFVLGGGLTPRRMIRLGFAAGGPALTRQIVSEIARLASDAWLGGDSATASPSGKPSKAPRSRRAAKDKE